MKKDIPGIISLISLALAVFFGVLAGMNIDDIFISLTLLAVGLFFIFLSIHHVINDITKKRELVNVIPVFILGIIPLIIAAIQLLNWQDRVSEILIDISRYFPGITILDIVGICFTLIGFGIIIIPEMIRKRKKRKCTVVVEGTVISLEYRLGDGTVRYPFYSYMYNGKEYIFKDVGRNFLLPKIGDKEEIYINPDDPEEAILRVFYGRKVRIALGIMSIISGISVLNIK